MENLIRIEKTIKAVRECNKALMKLSFKNYCDLDSRIDSKISDKNILNNNY